MRNFINKSVMILCLVFFGSAYAEGYVKQIINNKTDYNCFVMIHQTFYFPIDECLGEVVGHDIKTCEGPLYLDDSEHIYDFICQKADLSTIFRLYGTHVLYPNRSQSFEITYDIKPKLDNKSIFVSISHRPI
jgi:hypothetical protein